MFTAVVFFNRDGDTARAAKRLMSEVSNDMKVFEGVIVSFLKSIGIARNLALNPHLPSPIAPNEKGVPYTYNILEEMLIEHKNKIDKCGEQIRKKYWFVNRLFGDSWQFGSWYEKYHDDYNDFIVQWCEIDTQCHNYFGTRRDRELWLQSWDIVGAKCSKRRIFSLYYNNEEEYLSKDPKVRAFYNAGLGREADAILVGSYTLMPFYLIARIAQAFLPCIPDTSQTEDVESSISLKPLFF